MDPRQIDELLTAAETAYHREVAELEQFAGLGNSPRDLSGELDDVGQHPGDAASDTTEREVDMGLLEDARAVLVEIAAAKERLAAGTYGRCESCGEAIADARLDAIPWARRCRDHQASVERTTTWLGSNSAAGIIVNADEAGAAATDPLWDPEDDTQTQSAEESAVHELS